MSFESVRAAIATDPALAEELRAAATPEERAAILTAQGIELPDRPDEFPQMSDTAGGDDGEKDTLAISVW